MELITYRGLQLNIIQSLGWEREPLFDPSNTTYECTRVRGSVIVTYNPGAISYQSRPNTPSTVPPAQTPGKMPVETDVEIRRFLEQPRGLLTVESSGKTWLTSPRGGMKCDVRNGPFTKVNSVQKIPGERLWQIHLEFETYINDFPNSIEFTSLPGQPYPALFVSNRWYAADETNWQHLRTRIIQGVCTVRGDVLQDNPVATQRYIDTFRFAFCAFPVPDGFQRENVKVTVTPDGNSAHYTVIDTEQIWNKSARCPAVRIEVADTNAVSEGTALRALMQSGGLARAVVDAAAVTAYGGAAVFGLGIRPGRALKAIVGVGLNAARDLAAAAIGNLPKAYKTTVVRCWGNQRTSRQDLLRYAMAVGTTRMGLSNPITAMIASKEMIISQDSSNFVQVMYTVNWGLDVQAGALGGPVAVGFAGAYFLNTNMGAGQVFNDTWNNSIFASTTTNTTDPVPVSHTQEVLPNQNPQFPADSGTRGTASRLPSSVSLQTLVTQSLEGFDQVPPQP